VSWDSGDDDNDLLQYRVEASQDQGETWWIIGGSSAADQAQIDLSAFPGAGQGWRIRVQASDGLKVGLAEVEPIIVASKPPQVLLLQPQTGSYFAPGEEIALLGQAQDWEDGELTGSQLEWLVDGQSVGSGQTSAISSLSEGSHVLQLKATNSHGLTSQQEVSFTVAPDADYDGLPNEWEQQYGSDPNLPDASRDMDQDRLLNWQELANQTSPVLADTDGDGFDDLREVFSGTDPNDPDSHPPYITVFLPLVRR
jgi:hypothetical protein